MDKYDAVVLAAGGFPQSEFALGILRDADFVICCDGAVREYVACMGVEPDVVIGDGDSIDDFTTLTAQLVIDDSQETNDLTKAIHYIYSVGKRRVCILGATGKREDHTLGNISLLLDYMRLGVDVVMVSDYGTFLPARLRTEFACTQGQQVSVFNLGSQSLRYEGLLYPAPPRITSWWQGTLNECLSSTFAVIADGEYIVYLQHAQ